MHLLKRYFTKIGFLFHHFTSIITTHANCAWNITFVQKIDFLRKWMWVGKYFVPKTIDRNKQEFVHPILNMVVNVSSVLCTCIFITSKIQQNSKVKFLSNLMLVSYWCIIINFAIAKIYQYKFTASWTKFGHVRKTPFIDRKSFYLRRRWEKWQNFQQVNAIHVNSIHNC